MQAEVFNMKGEVVGAAELPEGVFGLKPRADLLHEAVTARLANKRSWTAHTKTRAEVSGGGKKPWKQKHTGRARAGSNRSPLWRKGGVTFGPRFVDPVFKQVRLPRRKARVALAQALSARAAQGALAVLDALTLEGAKTRQVAAMLSALGAGPRPLVVVEATDRTLALASRNVPGLTVALASDLNAYDVLAATRLIVTRAALEKVRSRWS